MHLVNSLKCNSRGNRYFFEPRKVELRYSRESAEWAQMFCRRLWITDLTLSRYYNEWQRLARVTLTRDEALWLLPFCLPSPQSGSLRLSSPSCRGHLVAAHTTTDSLRLLPACGKRKKNPRHDLTAIIVYGESCRKGNIPITSAGMFAEDENSC